MTADGAAGTTPVTASATVTVVPPGTLASINHVIFMLQENHTFDNYFGMLNPYRAGQRLGQGDRWQSIQRRRHRRQAEHRSANQDDERRAQAITLFKFKSTCIDDETSAWPESYGDVNLYDFTVGTSDQMDGFVHTEDGYAKVRRRRPCTGDFTDTTGDRAMGYYDQDS